MRKEKQHERRGLEAFLDNGKRNKKLTGIVRNNLILPLIQNKHL